MEKYENNAFFWQKIDTLVSSCPLVISRKQGDRHPDYTNLIYPVDYGHLSETYGDTGVCVYKGSEKSQVKAIIIACDILKRDIDVKLLLGCNAEEEENVLRFLNQTDF